ncbi:MAG: hypothetical protein COB02_18290 [Candidatus Cloacimonadota bacterium]|nr:MAG: hypothetical protein COB02_18290 [Candidatus Cloacimonadota bacterium]
MNNNSSTLTNRVAAIQIKMLHIQYKMVKTFEDQKALNSLNEFKNDRDKVKGLKNSTYSFIEMISTFEYIEGLMNDILQTKEINYKLDHKLKKQLKKVKSRASKWKPMRHKIGGHIDIKVLEDLCKKNGYKGVFISDDLYSDATILNLLYIQESFNAGRQKSNLLDEDIDFTKFGLANEIEKLVKLINDDWDFVFQYFNPMMEALYKMGKQEKMENSDPKTWKGIMFD